jgi:hypothetical protein
MLKEIYLELILKKIKDLEIRPQQGTTIRGKRIFLCQSRTSTVFGYAHVEDVLGPLCPTAWAALRSRHCVPGGQLYASNKNYAWVLSGVTRCHPIRITRKAGSIGIQVGPGL